MTAVDVLEVEEAAALEVGNVAAAVLAHRVYIFFTVGTCVILDSTWP